MTRALESQWQTRSHAVDGIHVGIVVGECLEDLDALTRHMRSQRRPVVGACQKYQYTLTSQNNGRRDGNTAVGSREATHDDR